MEEKSKGHIGFAGPWEFFFSEAGGGVWKAPRRNYIDVAGYRVGARFESTRAAWDNFKDMIPWEEEVK